MTNQQYHRRRRALQRLYPSPENSAERARLEYLVRRYQDGAERAIHGKSRRHRSTVAA